MPSIIDISGKRFGRLIALHRDLEKGAKFVCWACICDCGMKVSVNSQSLRRGATLSCGCLNRELTGTRTAERNRKNGLSRNAIDALIERSTIHGMSQSAEFKTWADMRHRCSASCNGRERKRYFDRGIQVCPEWESFEQFYKDMGPRPPGMSIERIDNDGNYEPGNCKWASIKEQSRNTSTVKLSMSAAEEIRVLCRSGMSQSKVARQFGVGDSAISQIVKGKTWI